MVYLKENNKLNIISSPIGYLRSIYRCIPLDWKDEKIKKAHAAKQKQQEQTRRQKQQKEERIREERERERYQQGTAKWDALDPGEKQIWFDKANRKRDPKIKIKNKYLWIIAKTMFCEQFKDS